MKSLPGGVPPLKIGDLRDQGDPLLITVMDETNVRQIPLAEFFILLFLICVWDTCKIKGVFILSPGDRGWEGVRLIPICLQKPRKCVFFMGNMRKEMSF